LFRFNCFVGFPHPRPVALAACQRFIRDTDPNTRKAGEPMIAATRATRQARTTALAMPLLKKASRIVVLTV
jgi:hypothetical protein